MQKKSIKDIEENLIRNYKNRAILVCSIGGN